MAHFLRLATVLLLSMFLAAGCQPGENPRNARKPDASQPDKVAATGDPKPPTTPNAASADPATPASGNKPAAAPDKPAPPQKPASSDSKASYEVLQSRADRLVVELPNRLIVAVQEMRTAPVVSAKVYVKTGSIYEQEHVGAGLSHYLEHLLSGGTTTTRPESETKEILGRIGAKTNASTSLDEVIYYINTTRDHAAVAVELLSDWMQNNVIEQKEFDRERAVIQKEFQMGEGEPNRILWKLMQHARYKIHPARHPTIGYIDEFNAITRDEIYAFYKRMYVPNNMVFVVVGDIDKQKVLDQVVSLWKNTKPGELPRLSFPVEPELSEAREMTGLADVRQPQLRLAWPGTRLGGEHDFAMDLLAVILGQGESSRLVRTVRDEQRLVYSIVAYNSSFHWGEGFFGVESSVAVQPPAQGQTIEQAVEAAVKDARAAVFKQIEKVQAEGVTAAELARAKRQTLAAVVLSAQSAEAMAARLATDIINMGDPDYLGKYARAIQDITAAEVQAAAKKFLTPQRTMTITLLPQGSKERIPLARPKDEIDPKSVKHEPFELDNAALLRTIRAKVKDAGGEVAPVVVEPVKRYVLSNGLRVLVGRNTLVPAVAIQLYQEGGLLADEPGLEGVANATISMQMKGTKTRSAQQIATQMEDLGAALSTQCGNNTHYSTATCLKADWPAVLELMADVTLNPTFPQDEWENMQRRLVATIERQNDIWYGELGTRFRETMFKDHPWSTRAFGRVEVVKALTPALMQRFHAKLLGADQAVLAVFGDVSPDEVIKKAEEQFGKMPAKAPAKFIPPVPTFPPAGRVEFATRKQTTAVMIGFGPGVARADPDYPALAVLISVMSDFPAGWLDYELRMKDQGLVYAVGAHQQTGPVPGYVAILFNCGPKDLDEALKRSLDVVNRARTSLVDAATLARAKSSVLSDQFFGKQSNSDRAAEAAINELYGLPLDESEKLLAAVQMVDAAKLKAVAEKYLANPVVVILKAPAVAPPAPAPSK